MAIFHLATSKIKAGQVTQAIEEFKRSEAILQKKNEDKRNDEKESSAAIHDGLGCCYHTARDFEQAIASFDKAIKAEPQNIDYLKNRA